MNIIEIFTTYLDHEGHQLITGVLVFLICKLIDRAIDKRNP